MNRRYFMMSAAAATAARKTAVAANDKINVAIIGVRGRGKNLANEFALVPEANLAYTGIGISVPATLGTMARTRLTRRVER